MFKTTLAAFTLTLAPAMAIDLESHINALVNMSAAKIECGLIIPEKIAYSMLMDVAIETGVDPSQLAVAIDMKANEFSESATNEQARRFCIGMRQRYNRLGINQN